MSETADVAAGQPRMFRSTGRDLRMAKFSSNALAPPGMHVLFMASRTKLRDVARHTEVILSLSHGTDTCILIAGHSGRGPG